MSPDGLAALHAAAFRVPRPWSAAEFATLLADPHVFLVAGPDGFALGRAAAGEAELLTIAVRPEARRQGIGSGLLGQMIAAAAARGATRMFLEVSAENDSAIALYQGAGFADVGCRRGYFRDGSRAVDALVMARDVGANIRSVS